MEFNRSHFKKSLNVFSLCVFGIGTIIGAGIYSVTGLAYEYAQGTLWLSFLLAGGAAVCTAFSYCELSGMYPSAGAEYIYVRKSFPLFPYLSFIIAMVLLFAGIAITATVSLAFAGYLHSFFDTSLYVSAIGIMIFCTIINNLGVERSNRINILFTMIEILGIFFVLWFGFTKAVPAIKPEFNITQGTLTATSLIFFVYLGFEEIVNLSEEANDPFKDVPKAIFLSLLITTVLYLLVSFAVMRLVKPEDLRGSLSPLSDTIIKVAPGLSKVMATIALFSTANTVLVTMLVLSRMVFSMAREGDLPDFLGKIHDSFAIPHLASFFILSTSCVFLFFKNLELLVSFSSFATLVAFIMVNLSLIFLRYKMPDVKRVYEVPLRLGKFPIIPGIGVVIGLVMCSQFDEKVYLVSFYIIGLSSFYYFIKKIFK